jgi:hypothetical protein
VYVYVAISFLNLIVPIRMGMIVPNKGGRDFDLDQIKDKKGPKWADAKLRQI